LPYKTAGFSESLSGSDVTDTEIESPADSPLVLIVEDHAEMATFISSCLTELCRTQWAKNGATGIAMALDLMPDMVISDVMMPEKDGYELTRLLGSDERTAHIPILLLTAKANYSDKMEGLSKGAVAYLTKPFRVAELQLKVSNILRQQKSLGDRIRKGLLVLPGENSTAGEPEKDMFLEKIFSLVEQNLTDPLYGVEQLAASLRMSRTSLHRKVKALSGVSTVELIRSYRLKKAALLLLENYNVSEVALMAGFASHAYFSKMFKEFYKITPTEYLKNK
jgi:CheY-like chemotaxis protein